MNTMKEQFLSATENPSQDRFLLLFVGIFKEDKRVAVETLVIQPEDIQRKREYMKNSTNDNFEYNAFAKVLEYSLCDFNNLQKHMSFILEDIINEGAK